MSNAMLAQAIIRQIRDIPPLDIPLLADPARRKDLILLLRFCNQRPQFSLDLGGEGPLAALHIFEGLRRAGLDESERDSIGRQARKRLLNSEDDDRLLHIAARIFKGLAKFREYASSISKEVKIARVTPHLTLKDKAELNLDPIESGHRFSVSEPKSAGDVLILAEEVMRLVRQRGFIEASKLLPAIAHPYLRHLLGLIIQGISPTDMARIANCHRSEADVALAAGKISRQEWEEVRICTFGMENLVSGESWHTLASLVRETITPIWEIIGERS